MFQGSHFEDLVNESQELSDKVTRCVNIIASSIHIGAETLGAKSNAFNRLLFQYYQFSDFTELCGRRMDEGNNAKALKLKFQRIQSDIRSECDMFCKSPE